MLEILMEECEVPATFFGRDATLACYACGRTTSTVVDIGYHGTTVTPVFEGYVEQKGIRRSPIGTLAMDELALEQLQNLCKANKTELKPIYQVRNPKGERRKGAFHRLALLQIARECRESGAGQSINTAASKTLLVPSISYTLPDGTDVDVPSQNRFAVADFVFGARGEDDAAPKPREEALESLKKRYKGILEEVNKLDDDDEEQNDNDDMDIDEKKSQAEKYTEATAVGVTSRRSTRGTRKSVTKSPSKTKKVDSKRIQFDERILSRACSSYFTNHLEHLTAAPVANMVCDAAFRCDRDQQASMLGNVVLCGGGACIGPTDQAAPDLLREQIESIIHTHTPGWRVKMLSPSTQERAICSWLGGSILASLGVFHEMWITKAEYEEWGSAIVNRKCP
jgi:actin-related protein